ncbi:MAG: SEL1-like repeat protein, partial [Candidatus Thiodiazotropha sp. (ex Cardiolucina cf. quadrata)]|nr:SEL1-like repeat protein [Candidatus Thiodiazotropha sp. (ex Cardiolucina cf. quadrata)]
MEQNNPPGRDNKYQSLMLVLLLTLLLLHPLALSASNHDEAEAAIRIRDFARAAQIYQTLAESGDLEAQFALGGFYRSGRGVKKDQAQAYQWFLQAAQQEHIDA